jgi:hypothetical protein
MRCVVMGLVGIGKTFCFENGAANQFRDLRNYGVSEGGNPVCPIGNPISHSSQFGFKAPLTGSKACTARPNVNWEPLSSARSELRALLSFQSRAFGVGYIRADTASIRLPPSLLFRDVIRPPLWANDAVGVGHRLVGECFADQPSPL